MIMELAHDLEDKAREVERRLRPKLDEATERFSTLNEEVTGYIKANPVKCLLGAIAVGFVIGKLARR
jgi:ElaB/YqjD/DUF883 family membrane-anchored ribosome-binding protein